MNVETENYKVIITVLSTEVMDLCMQYRNVISALYTFRISQMILDCNNTRTEPL